MMHERTGDIEKITIHQVLEDLDVTPGEDFAMGDFDILGWQLAAKVRDRGSQGYNYHGALFRPNYERGILVHSLIQKKGLVKILEIGFGRGYAAACAANAIYGKGINGEVTTVDPYFDQQKLDNFASVLDPNITSMVKINTMSQTSDQYFESLHPKARFDLIFIDGDHRYDSVKKDYENAVKHIDRGYILMDDYHMPTKVEKDIEVSNFIDSLPSDVEKRLVMTDRLLFNDDRGKTLEDLDYGMVLLPIGDI